MTLAQVKGHEVNAPPYRDATTARNVSVVRGIPGYGAQPPYSPDEPFPEYPFPADTVARVPNPAYAAVRQALCGCELDRQRYGTPDWNPLGRFVRPGQTVVIKPNFVRDFRETKSDHANCLVTHGSVLRAVADFAFLALAGRGRLIIADAPQNDANFDRLCEIAGLSELQEFYRRKAGFELEVHDLRPECAEKIDGVIVGHCRLAGDPAGYRRIDLGAHSAFFDLDAACGRLYGAEYDTAELRGAHSGGRHAYLVSQTVLDADVVLNVPKLKTHKKCGLTACLKNLVGINGNKNWLPHYRIGSQTEGGDEFDDDAVARRLERLAMKQFRRWFPAFGSHRRRLARPLKSLGRRFFGDTDGGTIRSGNWHGNDTVWRTVLDLNRILLHVDRNGRICRRPPRRVFNIVDGIVAGEGDGPLNADPRRAGLLIAGANPAAVDRVCAELIGFDPRRLPVIANAFRNHALPLARYTPDEIRTYSGECGVSRFAPGLPSDPLDFIPHFGWCGHVERAGRFQEEND